jgi:DNA-directed RNA polymerase subunit RPC12/RpoP
MQRQEDWYAYLGLSPQAPEEEIAQAVERLSRQAAALAVTAPERSQRLRDTIRLIKRDLLSGQENRRRYDVGQAGWTCATCGREALPGDRFCTKCGTPIKPVRPEAAPAGARPACVNCGSALTARDVFCPRCGTRVHTER